MKTTSYFRIIGLTAFMFLLACLALAYSVAEWKGVAAVVCYLIADELAGYIKRAIM